MVGQHIGSAKNTELSGEIVTPPFIASTEEAREKVVINRPKRATHDRPNGATKKRPFSGFGQG